MRAKTILLLLIALLFTSVVSAQTRYPKREFRGAWIQCVNGQFQGMPAEKMQQLLINQLNSLQGAGINAIIFQVRAEADALYKSSYEPWSRFLTGVQGRVPSPYWDPMQFMIDECHKRGMEFHAWINPYRAKTKGTTALSPIHPYNKNPERFVNYAGQLYFDPALPENRKYICKIVRDIVTRYDVDAIHMDDYFYPSFTEKNVTTAFDAPEYKQQLKTNLSSTDSTSLTSADKSSNEISLADWRRDNVNRLVSGIYKAVKEINSDVTFGISPAGNLDNLRSDLEYYVDIDTWVSQNGYVDYLMPQIYWGFTNEVAPFDKVTDAWCILMEDSPAKLYIGLQLYRMGSTEPGQSDEKELQKASLLKKELSYLKKQKKIEGYCLFSYQYLDCQNKKYHFDAEQFSTKRKKLLNQIVKSLKNNS